MSILQYLSVAKKPKDDQLCSSSASLPDPRGPLSEMVPPEAIASANASVTKAITKGETSRKQKGSYLYLTDAQRYEVGKRAAETGTTTMMRYYAHKFPDLRLTEPTVRRLKTEYQDFVKDFQKARKVKSKKCLAKRSKEGHFYLEKSWIDRCKITLNTFVSEGLLLILQWLLHQQKAL